MKTNWILTDPNLYQYGRYIGGTHYEFKEFDRYNYTYPSDIDSVFEDDQYWEEMTIVLSHYSDKQIEKYIKGYYDSIDEVKDIYGSDWEFIVAECIFEQESGLY